MQGKYRCSQCPETFDSIKNYIAHLEMHKDLMPEVPKPRTGIARLLGKFKKQKINTEVNKMATKEETVAQPVPLPEPEQRNDDLSERMDGVERAVGQFGRMLNDTLDKLEELKKPNPVPKAPQEIKGYPEVKAEKEHTEEPTHPGKKKLKVSVLVAEAHSGDFLKVIQSNEGYELDDISVTK